MAVASLPTHKACGPDEIYNEHIKEAQSLIPLWCALFNECMERGVVPSEWCRGRMIVIPKTKVCPTDPKSWRGITKKSFVAKLFSGIILRRLVPFLDLRGCIPDQQHGFRAGRSTMSACYVLINDIEQALLKRPHHLHAVFIDFSAAFDSGSRMIALDLLAEYGVPEKLLKLFCALLQKNRIDIDDGVAIREGFEQTSGFPQGENTSPILFSILTSKLPSAIAADHPDVKVRR